MEPQHPAAQPRVGAAPPPEPECCAVCLSELVSGAETCRLRGCGHRYHSACIREWLTHQATCPMCRARAIPLHLVPDAARVPVREEVEPQQAGAAAAAAGAAAAAAEAAEAAAAAAAAAVSPRVCSSSMHGGRNELADIVEFASG